MKGVGVIAVALFALPLVAAAQTMSISFTSDAQTIAPSTVSGQIKVTASASLTQTGCLFLSSSAATGQFSSSATDWKPVPVLSMSKGTANKNFFYQDATPGAVTLTATLALKPIDESSSCSNWTSPPSEWGNTMSATQAIMIGSGGGIDGSGANATTSDTSANDGTQAQSTPSPSPTPSYVAPPAPSLFADAGADRAVIVGADTEFDARAYDKNKNILDTARFLWNFGDGSTAEGESVLHHWNYPDRYAVILTIAEEKNAALDELIVTAEPAKLGFYVVPDGGVKIENLARRDLDLSGWLVRAADGLVPPLFTLPSHSVILSGSSMYIDRATLGFQAGPQAILQYPNGVAALHAGETTAPTSDNAGAAVPAPAVQAAPTPTIAAAPATPAPNVEAGPIATSATSTMLSAAASNVGSSGMWWWAAAALATAAAYALFLTSAGRRFRAFMEEWVRE